MPDSMPAAGKGRREAPLLETVIACDKREAFAQVIASDEAIRSYCGAMDCFAEACHRAAPCADPMAMTRRMWRLNR